MTPAHRLKYNIKTEVQSMEQRRFYQPRRPQQPDKAPKKHTFFYTQIIICLIIMAAIFSFQGVLISNHSIKEYTLRYLNETITTDQIGEWITGFFSSLSPDVQDAEPSAQ